MLDSPQTEAVFTAESTDDLARMVMALTQEVWVIRDRMFITERLLEAKAGITPEQIDDFVLDPVMEKELAKERDRYAAKIIGAPLAGKERSIDAILSRAGLTGTSQE